MRGEKKSVEKKLERGKGKKRGVVDKKEIL